MKKRTISAVILGVTLMTSYGFQHSASAALKDPSSNQLDVSGHQMSLDDPHFVKKAAVVGGKFLLKQLTSAWAADQWGQTSVQKEYEIDTQSLEALFDQ